MSVEYEIAVDTLPSSIEAYLLEADFSATEILILKCLLRESALTLREIAMKTGKSTGVLDQAMKKPSSTSSVKAIIDSYKEGLYLETELGAKKGPVT